jgi:T5orf172 domain/Sel1 repeat
VRDDSHQNLFKKNVMNNLGFLYVLANSAMPGLVKVGKTNRSPSERAGELSGVTGVPTPFIVIYEQLFQDCDAAETFVHTFLAQKGHRISDAREFFNAPSNTVIRAIGLAPGAIEGAATENNTDSSDDFFERRTPDELDALVLMQPRKANPWDDILAEANDYYYGHDDCIQDYAEALRLYLQAAKLGSIAAHVAIGDIYAAGDGVRVNAEKALNFYKEGARKGSWLCYWKMGMLFGAQKNYANADKCFALFLKNLPVTLDGDSYDTNYEFHRVISTQAEKFGSIAAYIAIGDIYADGDGVPVNAEKALNFYREGARKGSWFCYWKMGMLFGAQKNYANADKCFALFLKNLPVTLDDDSYDTNYEFHRVISTSVSLILRRRWTSITDLHSILDDFFAH